MHLFQYSSVANTFIAPDGYFPYTGYSGYTAGESYQQTWREGFWQQAQVYAFYTRYDAFGDTNLMRGAQVSVSGTTKTDLYCELDYSQQVYQSSYDNYWTLSVTKGATNRFAQYGMQASTGVQGSAKTSSIGPSFSFRLLKHLDLTYLGLLQNRLGITQQHILTANYELSPTRSLGGRFVTQDADTNLYLFFHNSGGKGIDYFLIFGDPQATRTVTGLQVKVVFSF